MLTAAFSTAADLGRLAEIASVFIRHRLGDTVRRLGLAAFGLLGFAAASVGGLWLPRSMWRGAHPRDDDGP